MHELILNNFYHFFYLVGAFDENGDWKPGCMITTWKYQMKADIRCGGGLV